MGVALGSMVSSSTPLTPRARLGAQLTAQLEVHPHVQEFATLGYRGRVGRWSERTAGGVLSPTRSGDRGRFTDELLDPMRLLGDPAADLAVAAVYGDGDVVAVNDLMHRLVHATDPDPAGLPPTVRDYLHATFELPPWTDADRIDRAERTFQLWGLQISLCLFCASLPSAYACANGAHVLHVTGQLLENAPRRIMETGQFIMDVMAPGGLDDGGSGRRTIQRVRLMHAGVRHLVLSAASLDPDLWDDAWGHPLNQEDLAGTLLSFSYVPAGPLRRLGVRLPDRDLEDYLHCWNVIGHQLGLREDLLVADLSEATQLVSAIGARQTAPSHAGTHLTGVLVELLDRLIPAERFDAMVPALIRRLAGTEVADLLEVPPDRWPARLALRGGSMVNRVLSPISSLNVVEPIARRLLEAAFKLERGGARPMFDIPTVFADPWKIRR